VAVQRAPRFVPCRFAARFRQDAAAAPRCSKATATGACERRTYRTGARRVLNLVVAIVGIFLWNLFFETGWSY
jgi:hypothetical protein